MKTKNKVGIAFTAIILGLIVSPAVASNGAEAMRKSMELAESGSKPSILKTVMIVGIENPQFVPQFVQLNVNDSIKFINQDGQNGGLPHDVVSVDHKSGIPDGNFNGTLLKVGDTFIVKFTESGTYHYTDSIFPQMHGAIVVE